MSICLWRYWMVFITVSKIFVPHLFIYRLTNTTTKCLCFSVSVDSIPPFFSLFFSLTNITKQIQYINKYLLPAIFFVCVHVVPINWVDHKNKGLTPPPPRFLSGLKIFLVGWRGNDCALLILYPIPGGKPPTGYPISLCHHFLLQLPSPSSFLISFHLFSKYFPALLISPSSIFPFLVRTSFFLICYPFFLLTCPHPVLLLICTPHFLCFCTLLIFPPLLLLIFLLFPFLFTYL